MLRLFIIMLTFSSAATVSQHNELNAKWKNTSAYRRRFAVRQLIGFRWLFGVTGREMISGLKTWLKLIWPFSGNMTGILSKSPHQAVSQSEIGVRWIDGWAIPKGHVISRLPSSSSQRTGWR